MQPVLQTKSFVCLVFNFRDWRITIKDHGNIEAGFSKFKKFYLVEMEIVDNFVSFVTSVKFTLIYEDTINGKSKKIRPKLGY